MQAKNSLLTGGLLFLQRQERDWKVTVFRTSLDKFSYQMLSPYLSLFIISLGATATQLGLVNSLGMLMAAILSPFIGWKIDGKGPKKIYMTGIGLLAFSYFTYSLAANWSVAIIAMVAYWLGFSISTQSCATICGNCLVNEDRATGMMICETVAAGLLGMAGPMLGAWLVFHFGGVNSEGIRPLFYFTCTVSLCSLFLVATQLSGRKWSSRTGGRPQFFSNLRATLTEEPNLRRWLVIASVGNLPIGMVFPFAQVYANLIKGAHEVVLGAMVTGASLTSIVLAIPLGRLADRIGRKRILYFTIPLFWTSNILLVLAPNSFWLIVAGILQGFYWIGAPIAMAMERELVPAERMGRWLGITRCCRSLLNSLLALAAGVIWDKIGPQYVFFTYLALDLFVRMPLLVTMPETLRSRFTKEKVENISA